MTDDHDQNEHHGQAISWSKNGFICYAADPAQGHNLKMSFIENTNGTDWQIAPPHELSIKPSESSAPPNLHTVQWSNLSTDLAILDEHGNFYILLAGVGLLRPKKRDDPKDSKDPASRDPTTREKNEKENSRPGTREKNDGSRSSGKEKSDKDGSRTSIREKSDKDSKKTDSEKSDVSENTRDSGSQTAGFGRDSKPETKDEDGPSYELTSYNHIEMIYRDIRPGDGGGHGPGVAFRWLGIEKPQIINKPAHLSPDGRHYVYGVQSHQATVAAHPIITKQACVVVRQDGSVVLYYQGEHKVEYHKMEASLTPMAGSSMYLTHASVGFSGDKKICITCYDAASSRLYCYLVSIDWGFLTESAARQRSDPHYHTPKDKQIPPKISVELIHEMKPMARAQGEAEKTEGGERGGFAGKIPASAASWTLISIDSISPCHEAGSELHVLVSYEIVDEKRHISYVVQRFTVKDVRESLSGPFAGKEAAKGAFFLEFQDTLSVGQKLKAIKTALGETIVLLVHEDGSVKPISRKTWRVIGKDLKDGEMKVIESILDCGFRFPRLSVSGPFLFAVSPNMACVVYAEMGKPLEMVVLESHISETNEKLDEAVKNEPGKVDSKATFGARKELLTAVAYSHTHAHACYSNSCSDDLMALVKVEYDRMQDGPARRQLVRHILSESHSAINFQLNSFGKESVDKLLSNPPLQKLLSFQLVLSNLTGMRMAGDIAWIVLNLRSTSFGIMFSLSSIYRQISKKKPAQDTHADSVLRAECIVSLVGNVKWLIDLIIYLNQELLQLWYSRSNPQDSAVSTDNSIALPIILSKVPRLFLMYALSSIGKTQEILKKLHKDLSDSNKLYVPMKEALERFFSTSNSSPLKLSVFETFLRECETHIAKDPECILNRKELSLEAEKKLLCYGEVAEPLRKMAFSIVDRHMAAFSRDPRLSDLYFYDNRWIDVGVAKKRRKTEQSAKFDEHGLNIDGVGSKFGEKRTKIDGNGPNLGDKRPKNDGEPENDLKASTVIRFRYSRTEAIDALRKIFISCGPSISCSGNASLGNGYTSSNKIRKCVRCRSVSLVSDPLVFESSNAIGLWTMVFQRTCICGSAWVNCESGV